MIYPLAIIPELFRQFRSRREQHKALREARGITLLLDWLSTEQKAQFEASECFDVIGCHTGNRYRIRHATGTNVLEIDQEATPWWLGVLLHRAG